MQGRDRLVSASRGRVDDGRGDVSVGAIWHARGCWAWGQCRGLRELGLRQNWA